MGFSDSQHLRKMVAGSCMFLAPLLFVAAFVISPKLETSAGKQLAVAHQHLDRYYISNLIDCRSKKIGIVEGDPTVEAYVKSRLPNATVVPIKDDTQLQHELADVHILFWFREQNYTLTLPFQSDPNDEPTGSIPAPKPDEREQL